MYDRSFRCLLFIVAGVLAAYVAYLGALVLGPQGSTHRDLLQPLAVALVGLLGVGGVVLQLQAAATREQTQYEKEQANVTAAIMAEMKSIMTIISKARIPMHFAVRFVHPKRKYLWADAARKEDYLTVYQALAGKFGLIKAVIDDPKASEPERVKRTIDEVVNFYNYFKAARDATVPLEKVSDADTVRQASKAVLLLLHDMYESGARLGLGDGAFNQSRKVLDDFAELAGKHRQVHNDELAALWEKHPVFEDISERLFSPQEPAPETVEPLATGADAGS